MIGHCAHCGRGKPGTKRRYDVSDLDVGWSRAFVYVDQAQRQAIRMAVWHTGRRDGMSFKTRTTKVGTIEVTRTA